MWKYKRFALGMKNKPNITEQYLKQFLVRKPTRNWDDLHPNTKRELNRITAEPEPLTYKLQNISERESTSKYEMSPPLGGNKHIPFFIQRTHTNNLPVYTVFKNQGNIKLTTIRHIRGDVQEFKNELAKIVSNSDIFITTGRVSVKGLHAEKVKLWLRRLGF